MSTVEIGAVVWDFTIGHLLLPSGHADADLFGSANLPFGALKPTGHADADLFGTPGLIGAQVLSPDTVVSASNLQDTDTTAPPANLDDIAEDTGSPDSDWWTAVDPMLPTETLLAFPTPDLAPEGAQLFNLVLRKTTGSDNPLLTVELRESGILRASLLSGTAITSASSQLVSAAWDASVLTASDGSSVEVSIAGSPISGALAEVASIAATDRFTSPGADPWDDTVAVPTGANRIVLVFDATGNSQTVSSVVIDPGGGDAATLSSTTVATQSGNKVVDSELLEADAPAAGNYTFRTDWTAAAEGFRHIVTLRDASQTTFRGQNTTTTAAQVTASVTRPSGTFPAGSLVYAALCDGDGGKSYTVTGDATEVRDTAGPSIGDRFVFAAGVLATAKATVSVTFTASAAVNRQAAMVKVIEPAAAANTVEIGAVNWVINSGIAAYSTAVLAAAPVAYWPLGSDLVDVAGGKNGVLGAGSEVHGQALAANGVGSFSCAGVNWLAVLHNVALKPPIGTVMAWFKPSALASGVVMAANAVGTSNPADFALRANSDGSISCFFQQGGVTQLLQRAGYYVAGQIIHAAVTFGAAGFSLYLDGLKIATNLAHTVGLTGNVTNWRFGHQHETGTAVFNGLISDFAIWDRELSDVEISNLALLDYRTSVEGLSGGAPLAYWKLDELLGTTMLDERPGARHGTYTGAVALGAAGLPLGAQVATNFAGTGEATIPHDSGLILSAFSLSLWFQLAALPGVDESFVLFAKDQTGLNLGDFSCYVTDNGTLTVVFQSASAAFLVQVPTAIERGSTNHLVVRADSTGFDVYLNGKYISKNTGYTNALGSNTQAIQLAGAPWTTVKANAILDEVALYSRVLTEAEVLTISQTRTPPVANNVSFAVPESVTTVLDVLSNDVFVGQKTGVTVTIVAQGARGTATVRSDRNIDFAAAAVPSDLPDSFTYRITDANGTSNIATVNLTVQDTTLPPPPSGAALCFLEGATNTVVVNSIATLNAAIAAAGPGRNILVTGGTITGGAVTVNAVGAAGNPIVIRPQGSLGSSTFTNVEWNFSTSSKYVVIEKFNFNGGHINLFGSNHRVARCQFRRIVHGPVYIKGATDTRIDHCDFSDYDTSSGSGSRSCIRLDPAAFLTGATARILIDYCYFHDISSVLGINGQEMIKWFAQAANMNLSPATKIGIVDHCIFTNITLPGEGEVISFKSGGWTMRFCTVLNTTNLYTSLRVAANCEVRSNWFENMAGAAFNVFGENHLFIGNRFIGGLNARIAAGNAKQEDMISGAAGIGGYARSRNCQVIGNRMGSGFLLVGGYWSTGGQAFPALNNNLSGNTRDSGGNAYTLDGTWSSGTTFVNPGITFAAAVKLTTAEVGLTAADPLCD